MNMTRAHTLLSLMRRELWESPVAFKWTPLGIAAFITLMVLLLLIIGARVDTEMAFTLDGIRMFAEQPREQREAIITGALFSVSVLFIQIMILVVLFYLAGSLYDDRKDRSILFWKSLPVSDRMTVASKILTACLLVPVIFLAGIILTQIILLVIATAYGLIAGINPVTTFWLPASLPHMWTVLSFGFVVQALWLLPIYAWLVFCSSWAPRLPILIAIVIPLMVGLMQHFWSFYTGFRLPEFNLLLVMLKRLGTGALPMSTNWNVQRTAGEGFSHVVPGQEMFISFSTVFGHLLKPEMWIGVAIALVFLAASVWFRRRATDN